MTEPFCSYENNCTKSKRSLSPTPQASYIVRYIRVHCDTMGFRTRLAKKNNVNYQSASVNRAIQTQIFRTSSLCRKISDRTTPSSFSTVHERSTPCSPTMPWTSWRTTDGAPEYVPYWQITKENLDEPNSCIYICIDGRLIINYIGYGWERRYLNIF